MFFLILLFSLIAPLALYPIEIFFPYPHIVEELVKALLIFSLLKSNNIHQKVFGAILIGFLFGLSENLFYLFNPITIQTRLLRFILTMPLHMITSLIILMPALINKRLIFLGIILAGLVHYFFNIYVSTL